MKKIIILYILLPALLSASLAAFVMYKIDQRIMKELICDSRTKEAMAIYENKKLKEKLKSVKDEASKIKLDLKESEKQIDRLTKKIESQVKYVQWIQEEYPYPIPIMHKIEVIKNCLKYGYDPHIQFRLIGFESGFKYDNQNPASSARGYGQILRSTGRWIYEDELNLGKYNHKLAYDPYINIQMSTWYMSYLLKRNRGNVKRALMGYNGYELGDLYWKKVLRGTK